MKTLTTLAGTVLAALVLAAPAQAAPVQVITDAAGDIFLASPLAEDAMDLTGVTLDSDGTYLNVTFELVDLSNDQVPIVYNLEMDHTDGTTTQRAFVRCYIGDFGSALVHTAFDAVGNAVTGGPALACYAGTFTTTTVLFITVFDSTSVVVPHVFDATAETVTATVPYSAFGAASGDSLSTFSASTCDGSSFVSCMGADDATGTGPYAMA